MRNLSGTKLRAWSVVAVALLPSLVALYGCGASTPEEEVARPSPAATQGADTTAPSTPSGLSASAVSASQINLSWSPSTDNVAVTGYRVYRNAGLLATLGNVTAYQNTGLSAATTYSYTVQALDAAGNASAQSTAVIVQTAAALDTIAPSTPTALVATVVSASRIDLSWLASTDNVGVTAYRVFRGGALVAALGNVTTYQDGSLSPSTSYVYTVQALDAAGNASAQSSPASATPPASLDTIPPTTPTNLVGNAVSATQINLSWSPSTDNVAVANYRLYRNGVVAATLTSTTYQDSGLSAATTYTYRADAVDTSGNASGLSGAVTVSTPSALDTTPPTTPTGLTATAVSNTQINLSWAPSTDNVGVTGYRVIRNGSLLTTLGNLTTFQDTGLNAATTYTYGVQALDAAGNLSPQSTAASATTQPTPDTTPPTTPSNVSASVISATKISITWSASTDNVGVVGYRVYRNGVLLTTVGNVTTAQDTGLLPSTTYTYSVDAIDGAGNASGKSTSAAATTLAVNTVSLAWDAVVVSNLAGYRVYYGTAPGNYVQASGAGIGVGTATTYVVIGLNRGVRYYFAVTAFDASNNESPYSNEVFADIP
jgi:chitodextrinase